MTTPQTWQSILAQLQSIDPLAYLRISQARYVSFDPDDGSLVIEAKDRTMQSLACQHESELLRAAQNYLKARKLIVTIPEVDPAEQKTIPAQQLNAWESVKSQVQADMPRASFDTWVKDATLMFHNPTTNEFMVGLRNSYARDWVESRLATTFTRLLTSLTGAPARVSFVLIDGNQAEQPEEEAEPEPEEEEDGGDSLSVEVAAHTDYAAEVKPERVVVPQAYAFRLIWFGDTTPKQFSLWIGFRQAVYTQWRRGGGTIRNIPWQDVCQYAMMSRASFFREIKGLSLPGLVEEIPIPEEKRHYRDKRGRLHQRANLYRVYMAPPLARVDAEAILNALRIRSGITPTTRPEKRAELVLSAIRGLAQMEVVELLAQMPEGNSEILPARECPGPTVTHIARYLTGIEGELPEDLKLAAEDLHERIISAFGTAHITHYFLEKVAPSLRLTHAMTWLIAQMRDRCYADQETGEIRDWVQVKGGSLTLARWAGISPKRRQTITDWLKNSGLRHFITEIKPDVNDPEILAAGLLENARRLLDAWEEEDIHIYAVRLREPLMSREVGNGSETSEATEVRLRDNANETPATTGMRLRDNGDETPVTTEVRPWGNGSETLGDNGDETLVTTEMRLLDNGSETHFKLLKALKPTLKTLKNTTRANSSNSPSLEERLAAVSPREWFLKKLFENARVSPQKQNELQEADPRAFVSWLLYVFSQPNRLGIGYALKQLEANPERGAGGSYDDLASRTPVELIAMTATTPRVAPSKYAEKPVLDPVWKSTLGEFNPRIADLYFILTGQPFPERIDDDY